MSQLSPSSSPQSQYELRFTDLFNGGRGFAFPCDALGNVTFADLSERSRSNYFYARVVTGRELSLPFVAMVD